MIVSFSLYIFNIVSNLQYKQVQLSYYSIKNSVLLNLCESTILHWLFPHTCTCTSMCVCVCTCTCLQCTSMCVCMYMYTMYIYVCVYMYTCTCLQCTSMCVCMYMSTMYIYVCVYTCVHVHVHVYNVHLCVCVYMYTCTHITNFLLHMYKWVHISGCVLKLLFYSDTIQCEINNIFYFWSFFFNPSTPNNIPSLQRTFQIYLIPLHPVLAMYLTTSSSAKDKIQIGCTVR